MIAHNKLTYNSAESMAVRRVIDSGYWAAGKEVNRLEEELKAITKRKYAFAVSSGLSAITLALLALKVKKGDEVIIPAYSCVAIINAVLFCKAKPVPVDVLIDNWNIDPDLILTKVTSRTKAIIVVNTFGVRANFNKIKLYGIPIIEDCAHAIGGGTKKSFFGKNGIISITSFYATKLIGGGEGGAVLTDDKNIAEFVNDYRDYTDKKPSGFRLNNKMSDIHASVSLCQLKRLNEIIVSRLNIASTYDQYFKEMKNKFPDFIKPKFENRIWYRYVIYIQGIKAKKIIQELEKKGINSAEPVEFWVSKNKKKEFPISNFAYEHLVSIPIFPTLRGSDILKVINAIKSINKNLQNGRK